MSIMSKSELDEIATRAEAFGNQILNDPVAWTHAVAEPVDTLARVGLLRQAAFEFLQKYQDALADATEVSGYAKGDPYGFSHPKIEIKGTVEGGSGVPTKGTISVGVTFQL